MAHRAPLLIEQYSPAWPMTFERERERLLAQLPAGFVLEHIGSTSVPGLAAKSIIDMMLGGPDLAAVDQVVPRLQSLGYDYRPEHEVAFPQRRFLALPLSRPRHFHLHAVQTGAAFWNEHLAFRDRLRADAELADAYAALKRELARQYGDDREGYTLAKSDFIRVALMGKTHR